MWTIHYLRTIAFKTTSEHLEREFGAACRDRYWKIIEALFEELGYRDYLGALQRYRIEHPTDIRLLGMSLYLVDYPFADRLYPGALEVLNRLRSWGQTVILSDGDVVFQPRKVERSGISEAVGDTCSSTFTRSWHWPMLSDATRRSAT